MWMIQTWIPMSTTGQWLSSHWSSFAHTGAQCWRSLSRQGNLWTGCVPMTCNPHMPTTTVSLFGSASSPSICTRALHTSWRSWSALTGFILVPRVQISLRHRQQSFTFSGPSLYNRTLPPAEDLRDYSLSLNTFKQKLKTHLFRQWTSSGATVAFLWFLVPWYKCCIWLTFLIILVFQWWNTRRAGFLQCNNFIISYKKHAV